MMRPAWHAFESSEALALALAACVAQDLRAAIGVRGAATLVAPGGRSPKRFLQALSQQQLEWRAVNVTLTDERWVPPQSERANARLLRENLLVDEAAAAHFVPLHADAATPEAGCAQVAGAVAALPLPFDAVVLGMGEDGHCASLFPGAANLERALDPAGAALLMPIRAPDAPEPRITLTLAALVRCRTLYLHIEGAAKRATLDAALRGDAAFGAAPIAAVLAHAPATAQVFCCP